MSLYGARQLIDSFRTVRRNTIQVAEDIPEADYQYRPAPASRSVAETLVHIAWLAGADRFIHEEKRLASFDGFDFGAFLATSEVEETRQRSKAEIIELLRTEGDRWVRPSARQSLLSAVAGAIRAARNAGTIAATQ